MIEPRMFLGRRYDERTDTWRFSDGSMPIPDEMRQEVFNAIKENRRHRGGRQEAIDIFFDWKDRLGYK